jgi:hypothetical protein
LLQLTIREELLGRFGSHEWIDVLSKADLPLADPAIRARLPNSAICVSVATGQGLDLLRRAVLTSRLLTQPAAEDSHDVR